MQARRPAVRVCMTVPIGVESPAPPKQKPEDPCCGPGRPPTRPSDLAVELNEEGVLAVRSVADLRVVVAVLAARDRIADEQALAHLAHRLVVPDGREAVLVDVPHDGPALDAAGSDVAGHVHEELVPEELARVVGGTVLRGGRLE